MWRRSLRVQLVLGLLLPLAAVAVLQLAVAYRTAHAVAQRVTDTLLLASARSIAEHVSFGPGGVEAVVPPSALGTFDLGYGDRVYYRVGTSDGRLLAGTPELPLPSRADASAPAYADERFRGEAVRVVTVTQPIPTPRKTLEAVVVVAATLHGQTAMVDALWRQNGGQQTLLVLVALGVVWVSLRLGLAPVLRLSEAVNARRSGDYRPFASEALQSELRPLLTSLNAHMERLHRQIEAQRRFTANAAHQLRTPLALLRTQASYALGTSDGEAHDAARAIQATASQLARMVNQLLALARSERADDAARVEDVDLVVLTRDVLEEYAPRAVELGLDLSFDVDGVSAPMRGDPGALRDLLVNLVDNAIRYTPSEGHVAVSVTRQAERWRLRIADSGPGIGPDDREHVFERFYRGRDNGTEGSGLGLAIVKEIADAHAATVALGAPQDDAGEVQAREGTGLVVDVCFPCAPG